MHAEKEDREPARKRIGIGTKKWEEKRQAFGARNGNGQVARQRKKKHKGTGKKKKKDVQPSAKKKKLNKKGAEGLKKVEKHSKKRWKVCWRRWTPRKGRCKRPRQGKKKKGQKKSNMGKGDKYFLGIPFCVNSNVEGVALFLVAPTQKKKNEIRRGRDQNNLRHYTTTSRTWSKAKNCREKRNGRGEPSRKEKKKRN